MAPFRRRRAQRDTQSPRKPLLPPEVRAQLPAWRSTAEEIDPVASVKFFMPGTGWTWYVVEFDNEDGDTCFGLVNGLECEAGYFSLSELEGIYDELKASGAIARMLAKGAIVLPVERDEHFQPARLSELRRLHGRGIAPDSPNPEP